jgi:hypothetical protein
MSQAIIAPLKAKTWKRRITILAVLAVLAYAAYVAFSVFGI